MATMTAAERKGADDAERLLTARDVAERLGVSERKVWQLRSTGALKARKMGGSTRWKLSDVSAFIEQLDSASAA